MKKHLLSALALFVITTSLCRAQVPMLYGLTTRGGNDSIGNIFQYTVGGSFTSVHSFGISPDGEQPWGSLIYASNKLLYGMTYVGGTYNIGTIFSFNIFTGKDSVVYNFAGSGDGATPKGGSLTQVNDSMLYGMTTNGGTGSDGTIFSYNINSGTEAVLYSFAGGTSDGAGPYGSLTQVNDSMLYGMTLFGGTGDSGVIFNYNINSEKETVVHSFASVEGGNPSGSLLLVNDSMLYGMTTYGGSAGYGVIFAYDILTPTVIDVHNFNTDSLGWYPYGSLIQAKNGLLYGMTESGGVTGDGIVFSYNVNTNTEKILHNFSGIPDGELPYGSVMQASDGNLYGVTSAGGANNDGMLFSYDITSSIYSKLIDFTGINAWEPYYGSLVEADTSKPAGINQLAVNNERLTIYPNPNNGQFTVKLNNNQIGNTLEIYNVLGEKIYQSVLSNSQSSINLSSQPAGLYFVYLKSCEGVEVTKVMVTK
jgi:uncharacterized repeat protein (TIGR03803 family)